MKPPKPSSSKPSATESTSSASAQRTVSPKTATALTYEAGNTDAPRVVATGRGHLADRIIALAEAHDIPLVNDPALAQTLAKLELDTEIPPNLYLAVAQILAFVYRLDQEAEPSGPP